MEWLNMSVEPIVDQFTLILQPTTLNFEFDDWENWVADHLIDRFLIKSRISDLFSNFGPIEFTDGGVLKNYTNGYMFSNAPFYMRVAFHPLYVKMGISIYFSAYAWAEYQKLHYKKYNEVINLHTFFQLIKSDEYTYRLSRIDLAVDFKNEGVDISKIYRSLKSGRSEVRYRHG